MKKRLEKYNNNKKKRMKRYLQENYWRGLQLKFYGDSQIRNTRGRGRKDGKRTGYNGKIPWNKKT